MALNKTQKKQIANSLQLLNTAIVKRSNFIEAYSEIYKIPKRKFKLQTFAQHKKALNVLLQIDLDTY